jgi:hypothetical protein
MIQKKKRGALWTSFGFSSSAGFGGWGRGVGRAMYISHRSARRYELKRCYVATMLAVVTTMAFMCLGPDALGKILLLGIFDALKWDFGRALTLSPSPLCLLFCRLDGAQGSYQRGSRDGSDLRVQGEVHLCRQRVLQRGQGPCGRGQKASGRCRREPGRGQEAHGAAQGPA